MGYLVKAVNLELYVKNRDGHLADSDRRALRLPTLQQAEEIAEAQSDPHLEFRAVKELDTEPLSDWAELLHEIVREGFICCRGTRTRPSQREIAHATHEMRRILRAYDVKKKG